MTWHRARTVQLSARKTPTPSIAKKGRLTGTESLAN
jgi:hypothetical protein